MISYFCSASHKLFRKPPDNLRNYHYLDTIETLLHFSTDERLGIQISNGEYLFYYQKKILKLIWWNFMRRNFMGFIMTSWKYLGQNYDRLHNKNNNNNTGKKVYNRNSLGKSLFRFGPPKKSVRNGNKIKGKQKMVFDKLKKHFIT